TSTPLARPRRARPPPAGGPALSPPVAELSGGPPGSGRRTRLLGVQTSGLVGAGAEQLALLRAGRWDDVERTIDRIEERFGRGAATHAALLDRDHGRPRSPPAARDPGRAFRPSGNPPHNR